MLNPEWVALIWAPRHYLPLMPFIAPLAVGAATALGASGRLPRLLVMAVLVIAVAVQCVGIALLYRKAEATQRLLQAIRSAEPEYVVTDVFWLPEEMGSIFYEKKFMMVYGDAQLRKLGSELLRHGVGQFVFVSARGPGAVSERGRMVLRHASHSIIPVESAGVPYMETTLYVCETRRLFQP